jgi:calcineurin-like phosphoesterase family protein
MSEIFFTSDYHLSHANIIKYSNRPYSTVEEMDEAIIANHNATVKPNDTVYFLGDFCFGDASKHLKRLNGHIIFITGSHDGPLRNAGVRLYDMYHIKRCESNSDIVLCHTAMRIWNKSHYGAWHLFGHSHGHLKTYNLSFDVGIDSKVTQGRAMSFDEVAAEMKRRKDEMMKVGRVIVDRKGKTLYCQDDVDPTYEKRKYQQER